MGRRRTRVRLLAAALALGAGAAGTNGVAWADEPDGTRPAEGAGAVTESHTVTLITGDQVQVDSLAQGGAGISVKPGAGRENVGFVKRTHGDAVSVVPADALPLLDQGVLDRRLFDVTGLVEMGYDDASRDTLPLIVQYADITSADAVSATFTGSADPGPVLASVHGQAVAEHKAQAGAFWAGIAQGGEHKRALRTGVSRVWLDGEVEAALDRSVPRIGAPQAWQRGLTGAGVVTAVLDTGVDATHPDLADAVVEAKDFTGDPDGAVDGNGHGTHVASIITGSGSASGGTYAGVAPDTRLLVGKVLGDDGRGTQSQIIAGMEWAADKAKVINMSLGSGATDGTDPVSQALNTLTADTGALFVVAAGNSGRLGEQTVGSPASADAALAVGAVDAQDAVADFSGRGPRVGDGAVKPEITAPGVGIVAARAAGTSPDEAVDERYARFDGTSMATPHVAGAAAILAQQHPDWRAEQLKSALTSTATPTAGASVFEQGGGRLDVARATHQAAYASPSAVSAHLAWPHPEPVNRTVTYRNDGDAPLELSLAVSDAPAGLVSVGQTQVRVPAHGSTEVTLTIDPAAAAAGSYGGVLIARSADGATVIRTALGVLVEAEQYDLNISIIDREGLPHTPAPKLSSLSVHNLDTGEWLNYTLSGDHYTARVPNGRYAADAVVFSAEDAPTRNATVMAVPEVTVDHGDVSVVMDARAGRPVGASVADIGVAPVRRWLGFSQIIAGLPAGTQAFFGTPGFQLFAVPTRPVTDRPFTFVYAPFLATPAGVTPARTYNLMLTTDGSIPENPSYQVRNQDLATVETRYHTQGVPGVTAERFTWGALSDYEEPVVVSYPVTLGSVVTEYFTPGPRAYWRPVLITADRHEGRVARYLAGQSYVQNWNRAPFGPRPDVWNCDNSLELAVDPYSTLTDREAADNLAELTGRAHLLRAGTEIVTSDDPTRLRTPTLPAGNYTLRTAVARSASASLLGTKVNAEWGFTVQPDGPDPECSSFPLLVLGAEGDLGLNNELPRGKAATLTFTASYSVRDTVLTRADLTAVEVSFDDGATWTKAPVTRVNNTRFQAVVPAVGPGVGTGFVSLRANVTDDKGNRVTQTVVRAYQLRP